MFINLSIKNPVGDSLLKNYAMFNILPSIVTTTRINLSVRLCGNIAIE